MLVKGKGKWELIKRKHKRYQRYLRDFRLDIVPT